MPAPPAPQPLGTGAVIRRLLRDYVGGQWGLLALAVFCMLLTSAVSGLVPQLVNWEIKLIFLRHQAELLLPLSLAAVGVDGAARRQPVLRPHDHRTRWARRRWPPPSATCSAA